MPNSSDTGPSSALERDAHSSEFPIARTDGRSGLPHIPAAQSAAFETLGAQSEAVVHALFPSPEPAYKLLWTQREEDDQRPLSDALKNTTRPHAAHLIGRESPGRLHLETSTLHDDEVTAHAQAWEEDGGATDPQGEVILRRTEQTPARAVAPLVETLTLAPPSVETVPDPLTVHGPGPLADSSQRVTLALITDAIEVTPTMSLLASAPFSIRLPFESVG